MEVSVRVGAWIVAPGRGALRREGRGAVLAHDGAVFPVDAAFEEPDDTSDDVYDAVVALQLACFLDGCDTSVVVFGRPRLGKSRLLFDGLASRFLRDAFRVCPALHLTWTGFVDGLAADLLGGGLVACTRLDDALALLRRGSMHRVRHSVLTVTAERVREIAPTRTLSTASFCELDASPGPDLESLERAVADLAAGLRPDYASSPLAATLRDSFGGRAFTWLLCCVDPDPAAARESADALRLAQLCRAVRNRVTVNGFEPRPPPPDPRPSGLLADAEGLFRSLLAAGALTEDDAGRVAEWLLLKSERDPPRDAVADATLPGIAEDTEPSEEDDSDADSDSSGRRDDFAFAERLRERLLRFAERTDGLATDRCDERVRRRSSSERPPPPEETTSRTVTPEPIEDVDTSVARRELSEAADSPAPSESRKKLRALVRKRDLKKELVEQLSENVRDSETRLKDLVGLCTAKERLVRDLSETVRVRGGVGSDRTRRGSSGRPDGTIEREMKRHEGELKTYRKRVERVKRQIEKDERRKNAIEIELVRDENRLREMRDVDSPDRSADSRPKDRKRNPLRHVGAKISRLDRLLKDKTTDQHRCESSDDREEALRKEIRNLRETRECLVDRRCVLGRKRKIQKSLSDSEERKLLEYEEAIEAIDNAIEYKNEKICGRERKLIDAEELKERGERLLMARLNKLSTDEMRTLLYKYFQKVIDLRTTCVALEAAAGAAQQEAGGWRRRCGDAWAALQHARLAHARRTTVLTARHYHTMNRLMSEINGSIENENAICNGPCEKPHPQLDYPRHVNHILESDIENVMTQHSQIASATAKIKLRDNLVEGDARLLNRIQIARFHQSAIPSQNLKQLQITNGDPMTRVTRQKNKLVITQEEKSNK